MLFALRRIMRYFAEDYPARSAMPKTPAPPESFEAAIEALEKIVQKMEEGALPLEEALSQYQQGVALIKYCQDTLNSAQARIEILEGDTMVPFNNPRSANRDSNAS